MCKIIIAQKGLPAFGKIDKNDLLLTTCPYEKDAPAYKLINWGSVKYDRGTRDMLFKTVYEKRERIKIVNEKGLDYANVTIPFYSYNDAEKIVATQAYVYNLDENGDINKIAVNKSSIYLKKINKYYSQLIIAFPNTKAGSVIEYKYTLERQSMGQIKTWNFQEDIPVLYSSYELTIPLTFKFSVLPFILDSLEMHENVIEESIGTESGIVNTNSLQKKFIMRNIKSLPVEPFMGSVKDYQQRLAFQLKEVDYGKGDVENIQTTWEDIAKKLTEDEDFGKQLYQDYKGIKDFSKTVPEKLNAEEKINFTLSYLHKNIVSNNQEGIYCENGVKKTWDNKTGNIADVNLLFIKILNEIGIKSLPILFSTNENGAVNKSFINVDQFNTTLSYIEIANNTYIVNAADNLSPFGLIPLEINNTDGFLVDSIKARWILAKNETNKYKIVMATNGELDTNGFIKGISTTYATGYAKVKRLQTWNDDKDNFASVFASKNNQLIEINDLKIASTNTENPTLEQKIAYTYKLGSSGNYQHFTPNYFTDFIKNPFEKQERFTDVEFGYLQDYQFFGNYILPFGYSFTELPQNLSLVMPDKSIQLSRFMDANENSLTIKFTIEFNKTHYPVSIYPELHQFYKKLFDSLNEQIVIKKK